jgi:hypothetical protein
LAYGSIKAENPIYNSINSEIHIYLTDDSIVELSNESEMEGEYPFYKVKLYRLDAITKANTNCPLGIFFKKT